MIVAAVFLLAFAGLICVSLSMRRHAGQACLIATLIAQSRLLRLAGWFLVMMSLALRMLRPDWRIGIVEWIGLAGLAAGVIVTLLIYRPRFLPGAAFAASVGAVILLLAFPVLA